MKSHKNLIALAVSMTFASHAHADFRDVFSISGFGTAGVTHSTEALADVTPDVQSTHGVGASNSTTARLDSRLALQVDAKFTEDFSAVVQAVTEYAVTESWKPEIALAHVKYRVNPNFSMRLGRITAPLYMLSEYQRVNYATPWVRQPNEVYNFLMAFDGIEGLYTVPAGDAVVGIQGFYGEINSETITVKEMVGGSVTVDLGASNFRIGYLQGKASFITDNINRVFDAYGQIPSPALATMVDALDPRDMDGTFTSVGYSYDPGHWFLRAEAIEANYAPAIPARTISGYINAGIRRGAWTPSLTFAHLDTSKQLVPGAADPIGILNMAVAQNNQSRHSYTAALRWDALDNVAFKLQATHVKNHAGSYGSLGNLQPGFQPGRSYNLISASVDFVF